MKVLVTGAAGFIGSHTVEALQKHEHTVLGIDNLRTGRMENLENFRGQFQLCDILDFKLLEKSFYEFLPDVIVHLAAQSAITTAVLSPRTDMEVNIAGTLNLLNLSKKYKVGKFVFASTSAVYAERKAPWGGMREGYPKEPQSPYGISKLSAEHYIRVLMPNHVIFRYGNVYGPRQTPLGENQVVPRAIRRFTHGDYFAVIGDGKQKRDFIHVKDVAHENFRAVCEGLGTYNLATGKSHSVNEVLREIEVNFNSLGYKWNYTDKPDPRGSVFINISKIKCDLGFRAHIRLPDGISETVKWWVDKKGI